jgi:hypothetical protein
MTDKSFAQLEVGKPFPGPYPTAEGCVLESWETGWTGFIQMPGLQAREKRAFKKGLRAIGLTSYSTMDDVTVPVMVLDFKGLNRMDMNFNARAARPENVRRAIDERWNMMTLYLLDGRTLEGIRAVGMSPEIMRVLYSAIEDQLRTEYAQADYDRALSMVYARTTDEIFQSGVVQRLKQGGA